MKSRGLKASSRHQALRTIRAFVRWLEKKSVHGPLPHGDPMEDITVKVPRELPRLAKVEDIQRVLDACGRGVTGLRNRAAVRGAETHDALTAYLDARENYTPASPLFAAESGESLTTRGLAQVLHRLSDRAGLPRDPLARPAPTAPLGGDELAQLRDPARDDTAAARARRHRRNDALFAPRRLRPPAGAHGALAAREGRDPDQEVGQGRGRSLPVWPLLHFYIVTSGPERRGSL